MSKRVSQESAGFLALEILWIIIKCIAFVGFGSIAGYLIVGGLAGTLGMLAGFDPVVRYARPVGWIAGAIFGLADAIYGEVKRSRKRQVSRGESPPLAEEHTTENEDAVDMNARFKIPTFGELMKSIGVSTLFGLVGGLLIAAFLTMLLISATTSPFTPKSWRPSTSALQNSSAQDRVLNGRNRDGVKVGTTFRHPFLAPIFLWSTGGFMAVGLLAGIVTAFCVGNSESISFQRAGSKDG